MIAFNEWYETIEKEYPLYQDKDGYNIGNFRAIEVGWKAALMWFEDRLSESQNLGEAFSKIVEELESEYNEETDKP